MRFLSFIIATIFLLTSCDLIEDKNINNEVSLDTPIDEVKKIDLTKNTISIESNSSIYTKILKELDYQYFKIEDNILIPTTQLQNNSIYKIKVYIASNSGNEKVILYEITVKDNFLNNSSNEDINSSSNDSNITQENNSYENNTTYSNNNSSSENNNTEENNSYINLDEDNDYIPSNIEEILNKNPNNSDENKNLIVDGVEGDIFFNKQWYIKAIPEPMNPSQIAPIEGNDLDLLDVYKKYMGYNGGNPIIIQIVDSGIDSKHEDLKDNFDLSKSLNGTVQGDPIPEGVFRPHGTMLSGIAAARAFNNKGMRGVAPFAKLAGSNWLAYQSLDALEKAWLTGPGANEIAVSNNSWGRYFTTDTFYEDIISQGVKNLRDGKGRVYIFASGNSREDNADANIQYIINNRYVIVVSALNYLNKVASYSTAGANIWISAYGGAIDVDKGPTIATTYISKESTQTWEEDINKSYTYAMAGSSAATPMVSGIVALIIEACPNLSYRDIKYIIAKSAKKIDPQNSSWVINSSGISFSRDYGFGLINTKEAINICTNGYKNLPPQEEAQTQTIINEEFNSSKEVSLNIEKDLKIEWVEATIDLNSSNASEFDIFITSPNDTTIKLLHNGTKIGSYYIPYDNWMDGGFRLSTGAMLDELSQGEWRVNIINKGSSRAKLKNIQLKIYGYKDSK